MLNLYFNFVVPLCLLLIFSSYSVSCFFIFKAIFLEYFRLTTKLKRGTVNSHFLCTHKCISSHYQCQNIYICKYICIHTHTHTHIYIYIYIFFFFTKDDPTLKHHYHLKSILYIRVHSWCCTFYRFGQMYKCLSLLYHICLSLLYHTSFSLP